MPIRSKGVTIIHGGIVMRISNGVVEINLNQLQGPNSVANKAYVWPLYNENKVNNIHHVTGRSGSELYYTKATDEFKEQVLDSIKNASYSNYRNNGKVDIVTPGYQPGVLFDALA